MSTAQSTPSITRRSLFRGATLIGAASLAAACGAGGGRSDSGGKRTVEHIRGVTVVPDAPQRIVTVGYSDQDPVLALGGRLAGVTDWYGDYEFATWPWAQQALGDQRPTVLNKGKFTGTPDYRYEEIAALRPDLILGFYTEMSQEQYDRLTAIAPTVAPPKGHKEFTAPWDVVTRLAGDVLGKRDEADRAIASVNEKMDRVRAANPQFAGRTAVVVERFKQGSSFVRAPGDPRSRVLSALGFTVPDLGEGKTNDGITLADEQMARLDQDLVVWNVGSKPSVRAEIEALPIYRTIPAVREGRSVFIDDPLVSGAWTWGTVLSIPTVVDALADNLARAIPK
ncbi:iron-siderophore ABC transporter substrate-binding protein [Tsukamurella serpentis]